MNDAALAPRGSQFKFERSDESRETLSVDLFCRVIDNWGDVGVCWRLARQLRDEYGARVRLIVDDLSPFRTIEPQVERGWVSQHVDEIEIEHWSTFEARGAACTCDLAIEAFACDPPPNYVESMASRTEPPVWINLEYLSAEDWVDGVHGLPSPHPKLPLTKFFFVPGFTERSGGIIREARFSSGGCVAMPAEAMLDAAFEREVPDQATNGDNAAVSSNAPRVFCFTYPHAPLDAFARALVPAEIFVAAALDTQSAVSERWSRLAPVPQTQFDDLLARFDFLLVRGEDSFVRAQLAGKPMLWHIYPTDDRAHLDKLNAWLAHYCEAMPRQLSDVYQRASRAFVDPANESNLGAAFGNLAVAIPALAAHAQAWRAKLATRTDLATRLMRFVAQKRET
jgi:uncharacterized repeat protein (TIGR03837 family)